jgi:hypothetical protein
VLNRKSRLFVLRIETLSWNSVLELTLLDLLCISFPSARKRKWYRSSSNQHSFHMGEEELTTTSVTQPLKHQMLVRLMPDTSIVSRDLARSLGQLTNSCVMSIYCQYAVLDHSQVICSEKYKAHLRLTQPEQLQRM